MSLTKYRFPMTSDADKTLSFWAQSLVQLADLPTSIGELFDPQSYDCSPSSLAPMTYLVTELTSSKFMQIGKLVWIEISVNGTTGGVASGTLYFNLPIPAALFSATGTSSTTSFSAAVTDGGTFVAGFANIEGPSLVAVRKYDASAFGIGTVRNFVVSGWYRIL